MQLGNVVVLLTDTDAHVTAVATSFTSYFGVMTKTRESHLKCLLSLYYNDIQYLQTQLSPIRLTVTKGNPGRGDPGDHVYFCRDIH